MCLSAADVCGRRVEQEGNIEGETDGKTEGERKQTFLHVSSDVNKVLKFHITQVLSVNTITNCCTINTFSFSQSGLST